MMPESPLSKRCRIAVQAAFLLTLSLTFLLFVLFLKEPHVSAGFDIYHDGRISHVASNSPAGKAGLSVGDVVEEIRIQAEAGNGVPYHRISLTLGPADAGAALQLHAAPQGILSTVLWFPWYRYWMLAVGLAAWAVGLIAFFRNPDAPGIVPFAVWSSFSLPYIFTSGHSLAWIDLTFRIELVVSILVGVAFHALILHLLIVFPGRAGRERWVYILYAAAAIWAVLLLVAAAQGQPRFLLHLGFTVAGLAAIALSVYNLHMVSGEDAARQAGWVLLPLMAFLTAELALREVPVVAGFSLPLAAHLSESLIALVFLGIPLAVLTAVSRSNLFQIDRLVNRTVTYAAVALIFVVIYVVLAGLISFLFDRAVGGTLPLFVALWVLFVLALLIRPVQRAIQQLVDQFFERELSEREKLLRDFQAEIDTSGDRAEIDDAFCRLVVEGTGIVKCTVVADGTEVKAAARPGAVLSDEKIKDLTLEEFLDTSTMIRIPLASPGFVVGYAELGKKRSDQPFTSADISFVRKAGREYVQSVERFSLRLRALQRKLQLAETREQIAGDLHDEVGSGLSTIALLAELLARNPTIDEEGKAQLQIIQMSARELAGSISNIVWSMLPEAEMLENLLLRMKDVAHQMLGKTQVTFNMAGETDAEIADVRVRRNVLLIFKEILHNLMRHSNAAHCTVQVEIRDGYLILVVEDDGTGFTEGATREGYGLRSMKSRADQIGGKLHIRSGPGTGTTVTLRAPLAAPTPSTQDQATS